MTCSVSSSVWEDHSSVQTKSLRVSPLSVSVAHKAFQGHSQERLKTALFSQNMDNEEIYKQQVIIFIDHNTSWNALFLLYHSFRLVICLYLLKSIITILVMYNIKWVPVPAINTAIMSSPASFLTLLMQVTKQKSTIL